MKVNAKSTKSKSDFRSEPNKANENCSKLSRLGYWSVDGDELSLFTLTFLTFLVDTCQDLVLILC
jgi:hypothetical protein